MIASVSLRYGKTLKQGGSAFMQYTLKEAAEPDSVVLAVGGRRVARIDAEGYEYRIDKNYPTGRVIYKITAYSGGESHSRSGDFTVYAAAPPVMYGNRVKKTYPHLTDAYTQGLLYYDGYLYESTGLEGQSSLRKVDLTTGKVLQHKRLSAEYFGEGLVLHGGKLYQITWKNGKAFVYDLEKFEPLKEFTYGGEGWGLASDGANIYMSDGTEKIYTLDPETFRRTGSISVYTDNSPVNLINEMEWIDGEIWANVYTSNIIIRIDPASGAVKGVVDMSSLLAPNDITADTDVLNGIAYDKTTGRIFVTGKNWNKLFEVEVFKK